MCRENRLGSLERALGVPSVERDAGGFDEGLEVRENSDLIWRLKKFGAYKYVGEVTATTSMRRYEQRGLGRMFWLWIKLWLQSHFGDLHHRHYETVR